jgi:hypothetical protein
MQAGGYSPNKETFAFLSQNSDGAVIHLIRTLPAMGHICNSFKQINIASWTKTETSLQENDDEFQTHILYATSHVTCFLDTFWFIDVAVTATVRWAAVTNNLR